MIFGKLTLRYSMEWDIDLRWLEDKFNMVSMNKKNIKKSHKKVKYYLSEIYE